jgi:glycosyltransferase involved in cell wall biosynthesis
MSESVHPLVSVCLITYNHAPYIAQALDSILGQRTDFRVEILVGEDESSDGTREIVLAYRERHPQRIAVILGQRSRVIRVDGRTTGRRNFLDTLQRARGKYVAYLEGDDYWTDALKLQKQADFLERRPDCSLCAHLVEVVDENGASHERQFYSAGDCPEVLSLGRALRGTPAHASSWMFRNFDLPSHPAYPVLLRAPAADDVLALILLQQGRGHCLQEFASAYRLHGGGTWSTVAKDRQGIAMLQFHCLAWQVVSGRERLSLAIAIPVYTMALFGRVLGGALRARSLDPVGAFLAASARQSVVPRGVLAAIYAISALLAPAYALYRIAKAALK